MSKIFKRFFGNATNHAAGRTAFVTSQGRASLAKLIASTEALMEQGKELNALAVAMGGDDEALAFLPDDATRKKAVGMMKLAKTGVDWSDLDSALGAFETLGFLTGSPDTRLGLLLHLADMGAKKKNPKAV